MLGLGVCQSGGAGWGGGGGGLVGWGGGSSIMDSAVGCGRGGGLSWFGTAARFKNKLRHSDTDNAAVAHSSFHRRWSHLPRPSKNSGRRGVQPLQMTTTNPQLRNMSL